MTWAEAWARIKREKERTPIRDTVRIVTSPENVGLRFTIQCDDRVILDEYETRAFNRAVREKRLSEAAERLLYAVLKDVEVDSPEETKRRFIAVLDDYMPEWRLWLVRPTRINTGYVPEPKVCQLCGGAVEFVDNSEVYGSNFGSGKVYRCKACGAYVGTYTDRPNIALGILATRSMRLKKQMCHAMFDVIWRNSRDRKRSRSALYKELAKRLDIAPADCHFGHFNEALLDRAIKEIPNLPLDEELF